MSAPTPQEIRDRLAKVGTTLAEIHEEITSGGVTDANTLTALLNVKTNVLSATATTLLVEEQQKTNEIAAAQVYASMGEANYGLARKIVEAARGA